MGWKKTPGKPIYFRSFFFGVNGDSIYNRIRGPLFHGKFGVFIDSKLPHNHGSQKSGASNSIVTFQIVRHFPLNWWIMGERVVMKWCAYIKWHEPCRTELEPFGVRLRDVGSSSNPQRLRSKHQPGLRKVTQNRQKNSVNLTLFIIWMDKSIWSCIYYLHISALMNQKGFKDICSRSSSTASCWKKNGQLLLWSKVIIGPTYRGPTTVPRNHQQDPLNGPLNLSI